MMMTNIYTHACSYYFSQSCVCNQLQTRVEYTETTIMFVWTITNGKNEKRFESICVRVSNDYPRGRESFIINFMMK